jgi:aspartate-semialdehyde dehydrogenase
MQTPKHVSTPLEVALLGATGVVGQTFLSFLSRHPFFKPTLLMASAKREGQRYADAVNWVLPMERPTAIDDLRLTALSLETLKKSGIRIVFSALPTLLAQEIEPQLAAAGFCVFSNASALRYQRDVPILIPDVNPDHLHWIEKQGFPEKGFVITNANCSTTGLVTALAPFKPLGIEEIFVCTYQSVSGAGFPGLSHLQIAGNAIPYIAKEEEKMVSETRKILDIEALIQPTCVRIDTLWGHLEAVTLKLKETPSYEETLALWNREPPQLEKIPSLPRRPVVFCPGATAPQPSMSWWGDPPGMTVYTGRVRIRDGRLSFMLLCNNIAKGAAGGSVANAEAFMAAYGDRL